MLYTPKEARELLGVSAPHLSRLARQYNVGELIMHGGKPCRFYTAEEIQQIKSRPVNLGGRPRKDAKP